MIEFTKNNAEEQKLVKSFHDFTTYFDGFHQNRANMYSEEEKSTAIAYRIIHQNLPKYIDNMNIYASIQNADFYKKFMKLFSLLVQMRNSDAEEDKLISPVLNEHGVFFETGKDEDKPLDADANGAYNIARKGLWIIEKIKNTDVEQLDKIKLAISNKEWLIYAQEHTL